VLAAQVRDKLIQWPGACVRFKTQNAKINLHNL